MAFDLARYEDSVARIDLTGIDFDDFRAQPLSQPALRCLRYMHDVEHHTTCYLRNLLNTRAHNDPEITSFLTLWNFEEHWHGDAIGRVLDAHGEASGTARIQAMRRRLGWRSDTSPVFWWGFSAVTRHFLAVHMTFGVINEWTTQAGYSRLLTEADHPTLGELLRRIMRQEGRHIDFYLAKAKELLGASSGARRTTRLLLRLGWDPVGSKVMPEAETAFLLRTLFGGRDGREVGARIDRRVDALPGLQGLGLMAGVIDRYASSSAN